MKRVPNPIYTSISMSYKSAKGQKRDVSEPFRQEVSPVHFYFRTAAGNGLYRRSKNAEQVVIPFLCDVLTKKEIIVLKIRGSGEYFMPFIS